MRKIQGYTPETFRVMIASMMDWPYFSYEHGFCETSLIGHTSMTVCWETDGEYPDVISVWFYGCGGDEIEEPDLVCYNYRDPEQADAFVKSVYNKWVEMEDRLTANPSQNKYCKDCTRMDCVEKRGKENVNKDKDNLIPLTDDISITEQIRVVRNSMPKDKRRRMNEVENAFKRFVAVCVGRENVDVPDWLIQNCLNYCGNTLAFECGDIDYPHLEVIRDGIVAKGLRESNGWRWKNHR